MRAIHLLGAFALFAAGAAAPALAAGRFAEIIVGRTLEDDQFPRATHATTIYFARMPQDSHRVGPAMTSDATQRALEFDERGRSC